MKSTLTSAIIWTLFSILFGIMAFITLSTGGSLWIGGAQIVCAIADAMDAGFTWCRWFYER